MTGGASGRSSGSAEKPVRAATLAASRVEGARTPSGKGFGGIGTSRSPSKCTAFRLVAGGGCPQRRVLRPVGQARSPFDCTAFRVASGAGCPPPESACRALGGRRSPLKFTARRVGLWADIHIGARAFRRSAARPHRSDTQAREYVRPADGRAGIRRSRDYRFTLTVEIHRTSSGCRDSCPRPDQRCPPAWRAPSPSKNTALRVVPGTGYPHGRMCLDRRRMHASKPIGDRQSVPEAAPRPTKRRCSPSKVTVASVVSAAGYPHGNA